MYAVKVGLFGIRIASTKETVRCNPSTDPVFVYVISLLPQHVDMDLQLRGLSEPNMQRSDQESIVLKPKPCTRNP